MGDEVVETSFGKFLINPRDGIGMTTKAGTLWDGPGFLQPIAWEYGRLGEPGITILDVGANIGTFSVWLAQHKAWRVIAVEPVPATMLYLKANLDLNKVWTANRVIPLQVAAYDRETDLWLQGWDPDNLGATALTPTQTAQAGEPVYARRLDDWQWCFGDKVSLIKVDAQGCDGAAILGLQETIRRDHPAIVFEWEADLARAHDYSFAEIVNWLRLVGYTEHPWPGQPNNYLARWSV